MTSTSGAIRALEAAQLAIRTNVACAVAADQAPWLQAALRLHKNAVDLDAIAVALQEAGHPPEAVQLAIAAVRSDMRRLGLFWSRAGAR